jgi:hypothetical protein
MIFLRFPYRSQNGVKFEPTQYTPIAYLASAEVGGPSAISRFVINVHKHPQYRYELDGVRISFSII